MMIFTGILRGTFGLVVIIQTTDSIFYYSIHSSIGLPIVVLTAVVVSSRELVAVVSEVWVVQATTAPLSSRQEQRVDEAVVRLAQSSTQHCHCHQQLKYLMRRGNSQTLARAGV